MSAKRLPEIGHVMDIMATCIDMAGATYPTKYKGNDIIPLEGKSLGSYLQDRTS